MPFNSKGKLVVPERAVVEEVGDPTPMAGDTYRTWAGDIFTRIPGPADIVQGAIGDCYLVASFQAILVRTNGPDRILEAVKDEGTHAVLRMYKDDKWHYIRISKRLPGRTFGNAHHSTGQKWVQLFEKAYAAFIKRGTYASLAGGDNLAAVTVFLGAGGGNVAAKPENALTGLRMLTDQPAFHTTEGKAQKAKVERILADQVGLTATEAADWFTWRDGCELDAKQWANCYVPPFTSRFDQIVEKYATGTRVLAPALKKKILDWYKGATPIPGVSGTALYTLGQLDFFRKVERAIATQHSVGVETKNGKLFPVAPSSTAATGEGKSLGLASDHAYSIVDTRTDVDEETQVDRLRYFLIRNPWGEYHREYTEASDGTLKPKAVKKGGDSWIELTDFFMYFHPSFAQGPPVLTEATAAFMTDLEGQLQREIARRTLRNWGGGLDE